MKKIPKDWRDLPKEERFKIPTKYFNIDEEILRRIRKIPDIKKRLIEAARIQYEMFNDIHSYLTAWIAGCGSDAAIRQRFGSTQRLLDLFFKPIKLPENIKPSWQDIKRRVKLPKEMTEELAEETGIHIGDGNLYITNHKDGFKSYRYGICGSLIDECIYHQEYVSKLMKELYNLDSHILKREKKNCVESLYKSKTLVQFKNKILNLPIGSKKNIRIPGEILKNKEFQKRCVVGIIDTDFNLTSSLAISGKMNNLFVTKAMTNILTISDIRHIYREYENYARFYINKESAAKIIEEWGLRNQKHLSKYRLYKEFKDFIPFSTTPERLAVLNGKLDIKELKKIAERRRVSVRTR